MGSEFTPIFLFVLVAIVMAIAMLSLTSILGPSKKTAVKQMPYESGMDPVGDARQRFDIRFYLVAIVFLLFDVELLYLYPWAVGQWSYGEREAIAKAPAEPGAARPALEMEAAASISPVVTYDVVASPGIEPEFRNLVFVAVMFLVILLTAADAYAWRKGVFEWR